jgi:hypothetical protein
VMGDVRDVLQDEEDVSDGHPCERKYIYLSMSSWSSG